MCAVGRFGSNTSGAFLAVTSVIGAITLSGCGADAGEAAPVDSAPIVIGDSPRVASPDVDSRTLMAVDPRADLDIDDQYGDGRSVVIDSVRVTRDDVYLVILDERGSILGAKPVPPGVQPVQIDLDRRIETSGDYYGVLVLDDGDARIDLATDRPLLDDDDDDDIIEEDFEYYLW